MAKCRYSRPEFIASYYDDALSEKDRSDFEAHLYTCKDCMEALLSLEHDRFFMDSMDRLRIARPASRRAFFEIVAEGIRLVKNLDGPAFFEQVLPVPARGKKRSARYRVNKEGVAVDVRGGGEGRFDVEVSGIRGKSTSLYLGGRLVEARAHPKEDAVIFYSLERGSYTLSVEGEEFLEFSVQ
jgi:hypothetical protein